MQTLNLNIEQKQTLALTPQLIQSIRILSMTRIELERHIVDELEGNPALEAAWDEKPADSQEQKGADEREELNRQAEDFDWAGYLQDKDYSDSNYGNRTSAEEALDRSGFGLTLSGYLLEQLTSKDLCQISSDAKMAYRAVEWVSEALDENGFLLQSVKEMAIASGFAETEIAAAVSVLQGLEPVGVAAENVRESLVLQYRRAGGADPLVIEIIRERLEDVARQNVAPASRSLGRKRSDVKRAFETIAGLNPKPGRGFHGTEKTQYIIPDIIIEKRLGVYEIKVSNNNIPTLTVSPYYKKLLAETEKDSETYVFLKDRLNSAAYLIKNLEQRSQTIHRIVGAIIQRQQAFVDEGRGSLRPMTLKQIADETGVHESTVSRAVRGKYIQTPHGVLELKKFFCPGIRTADGKGAAADCIKARINAIISAEDKRKPMSDREIALLLGKEGIIISRRTIAKYRLEVGVPSSDKRR